MRLGSERGDAALELALVTPVLMLFLLGLLQFGLWYHARHVVQTAALEAARAAAVGEDGRSRANDVLRSGLGRAVGDPAVEVELSPEVARVVIEATLPGLLPLPGLSSLPLSSSSTTFREGRSGQGAP